MLVYKLPGPNKIISASFPVDINPLWDSFKTLATLLVITLIAFSKGTPSFIASFTSLKRLSTEQIPKPLSSPF